MARRYSRKPKPKNVGAADRKEEETSPQPPNEPMSPSQPRAIRSQIALERNDDNTAVTPIRAPPTRSTGEPPVTYHADRHRKPYDTDRGTATTRAAIQPNTPCRASSAASRTPSGNQMAMYAPSRPGRARMGCMRG